MDSKTNLVYIQLRTVFLLAQVALVCYIFEKVCHITSLQSFDESDLIVEGYINRVTYLEITS